MRNFRELVWDQGDIIGGRYEVLQVLHGGMAIVYVVRDIDYSPETGRPEVMIAKSLRPDLSAIPALATRFRKEGNLWVNIHPCAYILRAYVVDLILDVPYIFADYVEEGMLPNTLAGWIHRKITPPEVALYFFMQIISGLSHAYENNVALHGDLKPGNILIDKTCCVKVADWGLSRLTQEQMTHVKIAGQDDQCEAVVRDSFLCRGTPGYAAPELAKGKQSPTRAADVFSLGVIFGEMLTGKKFEQDVSVKQVDRTLQSCFALGAKEQSSFAEIIAKFLGSDPELRMKSYDHNMELLDELFANMTGLRLNPPTIVIAPPDLRQAGQVAYSMVSLGEKAKAFEAFLDLQKITKSGAREDNFILMNYDTGDYIIPHAVLENLEEKLSHNPSDVKKILHLADMHFMVKSYDRSKELYERVLSIDDDNEKAVLGLIGLADGLDEMEESLRLGKKLVAISPPSVSKWIKYAGICAKYKVIEEGLYACSEAEKCGTLSVDDILTYGNLLFQSGKVAEAIDVYRKGLRMESENGYLWYSVGVCQRSINHIQECILSFENAIKFNGPIGESHNHLASLSMEACRWKDAIEHLKIASRVSPENPKVWFNMAQCLRADGRYEDAVRYFKIALSIDSDYELAKRCLSETLKEMGESD
jgi:serine/threonine protein kinase